MKKLYVLFLFNLLTDIASAQQIIFSEADRDEFRIHAKQLIEDFQMHLATIASKTGISNDSKNIAIASALECFIGKGNTFEYTDEEGKLMKHKPVSVITKNQYGMLTEKPLKKFLEETKKTVSQVKAIHIESIDIIMLESVDCEDGNYVATAYYLKNYKSMKYGRVAFTDVSKRMIKLSVEKEVFTLPNGEEQVVWPVFLGDVYIKLNK